MTWPPIPTLVRGAGGPITVRRVKCPRGSDGEEAWGTWDEGRRAIRLDRNASPDHQWRTLFHELCHAAFDDAGLEAVLEDSAQEALCRAIATARIQELRGQLGIIDS